MLRTRAARSWLRWRRAGAVRASLSRSANCIVEVGQWPRQGRFAMLSGRDALDRQQSSPLLSLPPVDPCRTSCPRSGGSDALADLSQDAAARGRARLHRPRVHAPDGEAVFAYERRVRREGAELVSTHLSRTVGGEAGACPRSARHTEGYALRRFDEVHAQTGSVGTVIGGRRYACDSSDRSGGSRDDAGGGRAGSDRGGADAVRLHPRAVGRVGRG